MVEQEWQNGTKDGDPSVLEQLLQVQKKQSTTMRVVMILNLILLVVLLSAALVLIPRTTAMLHNSEQSLSEVEELTTQAKKSLGGIDEMITNANQVLTDNANGMNEALENFNNVDFESLNSAITDLSDAVAPLANLVRMFN